VARHLVNAGCNVTLLQCREPRSEDAKINASICCAMQIQQFPWDVFDCENATLYIDALLGTGLDRTVTGTFADIIEGTNAPLGCCIKASMTISFVGMKLGFQNERAKSVLGEVVVTDIGCPNSLLQTYGIVVT